MAATGWQADGRRTEHSFFAGMALFIAATVFLGFARTYYLRPLIPEPSPPPPSLTPLIHVHGLLFTGWIVLLWAQVRLVGAGRVHLHRRLGVAGAAVAVAMIGVGTLTALHGVLRGVSPGASSRAASSRCRSSLSSCSACCSSPASARGATRPPTSAW